MPLLYLVRHGETAWNRERRWQGRRDLPLTRLGEAQARAAGQRLAGLERPTVLYASPLLRAWQTALIVGRACRLEPARLDAVQEVDVGSWEGLTADDAAERHPEGHARWLAGGTGWTDGETYAEMSDRVAAAVHTLAERHPEHRERIVVVAHGGPIRAIAARCVGLPPEGRRLLANGPNGSITTVDVHPDRWVLVAYNDSGHVDHLVPPDAAVAELEPGTE